MGSAFIFLIIVMEEFMAKNKLSESMSIAMFEWLEENKNDNATIELSNTMEHMTIQIDIHNDSFIDPWQRYLMYFTKEDRSGSVYASKEQIFKEGSEYIRFRSFNEKKINFLNWVIKLIEQFEFPPNNISFTIAPF